MKELPAAFIERMKNELGPDYPVFEACYDLPPVRGLRVNTLKISVGDFRAVSPWELAETGVIPEGFVVPDAENVGRHPFHSAGLFYMQEPSAMSVIAASEADDPGLRVLDLCAAPGGKSGGVAARMKGRGILVSNEIVPKRATLLSRNLERLGVANAAVISKKPDVVARELAGLFDIVLVDAPCSGEGMFRKDDTAIAEWSPEAVAACAARQSLILESARECVAPGGTLVYSTCTFSREENEEVIERFLVSNGDFSLEHMERLYPHAYRGEGHFVCRMRRENGGSGRIKPAFVKPACDKKSLGLLSAFVSDTLEDPLPDGVVVNANGVLKLVPADMPEAVMRLDPISSGVTLGEIRKDRFEPSHTFFMAALGQRFRREIRLDPDSPELKAFMSGNTLPCPDGLRGYSAVSVLAGDKSFPVGFGKAVGGIMKNHLPKGLYLS
ncbi:MAG: RsmF rRNA methyltransferase first C-terminal domain-containing protein [Clostridia bacterium]|nr:RsmF rRNA methyltransferase first C-terminal domain-containing protein [Clostridia bacterium]